MKERIQTAKTLVQHLVGCELRSSEENERLRIRKIRMVENVKGIRAKLEIQSFAQCKLLGQRQIELGESESRYVIAAFIPLLSGQRFRKCRRVQALPRRHSRIRNPYRLAGDQIGPYVGEAQHRRNDELPCVEEKSGSHKTNKVHRPVPSEERKRF